MYYHVKIQYTDRVTNEQTAKYLFDSNTIESIINDVTVPYLLDKDFIFRGVKISCQRISQLQVFSSERDIETCREIANSQVPQNVIMVYCKENVLPYRNLVNEITDDVLRQTQYYIDDMTLEVSVNSVRMLESKYLSELQSGRDCANLGHTIKAFDLWYRNLLILLARHFDDSNIDYVFVKDQDLNCNGYSKSNIYSAVQSRVAILLDKIENQQTVKPAAPTKTENRMQNKIYSVFVSSTYEDLKQERLKAMSTIVEMGHLPIGMEQFPAAPIEAFEYIKRLIDNADYYLLLLAGKYGTVIKELDKSYTQLEYEYAIEKGVPVIFLTIDDINKLQRNQIEIDLHKAELLEKFRNTAGTGRLRQTWSNIDELPHKIMHSLSRTIELYPRTGWIRADQI